MKFLLLSISLKGVEEIKDQIKGLKKTILPKPQFLKQKPVEASPNSAQKDDFFKQLSLAPKKDKVTSVRSLRNRKVYQKKIYANTFTRFISLNIQLTVSF